MFPLVVQDLSLARFSFGATLGISLYGVEVLENYNPSTLAFEFLLTEQYKR